MSKNKEFFAEYQGSFGSNGRGYIYVMLTFEGTAFMVRENDIFTYDDEYRCLLNETKIEQIFLPDPPFGVHDFLPRIEISPAHAKLLQNTKEQLRKKTE
jgi:hypothetical protein